MERLTEVAQDKVLAKSAVGRRAFLQAGLAAGGLLLLSACGSAAPSSSAAAGSASGSAPAASSAPAAASASAATSVPAAASASASSLPAASSASASASTAAGGGAKLSLDKATILFNAPHEPDFVPDLAAYQSLTTRGVQPDVQDITGADAAIKALLAGQAHFALSSMASGILAVGQAQQIKAAIPAASASYFTLVVSDKINSWKDMPGKAVGYTALSDASYWMTIMQAKKYGVDPKAFNWVNIRGSAARVTALIAGKIDAAQVTVGGALQLLKDPKFKRMGDYAKDFPNVLFNALWVSESMIKEHPDVIQAMAELQMQQHRLVQNKSTYLAEAAKVLPKEVTPQTASAAYDILMGMNLWDPNESRWNNDKGGEFTSKSLADFGAVSKYVPFGTWATTQFTDAALQKLGPYKA